MFKTNRMMKKTGKKFGRANFTDESQMRLTYASKRHPGISHRRLLPLLRRLLGVVYTYECRGTSNNARNFYCVDCLPLIQDLAVSKSFSQNTVGPAIWVEDGFIVDRDPDRPDYDPYTEDHTHFCLAHKQQEPRRNRRTAPSEASGPPAKQPAMAPRPSMPNRMGTPGRERTPFQARTPVQAAQTPVRPIKQVCASALCYTHGKHMVGDTKRSRFANGHAVRHARIRRRAPGRATCKRAELRSGDLRRAECA